MRQAVHADGEDESARPTQAGLSKVQVQEGGAGLLLFLRQDCTQELGGEPEQVERRSELFEYIKVERPNLATLDAGYRLPTFLKPRIRFPA